MNLTGATLIEKYFLVDGVPVFVLVIVYVLFN